MKNALMLLVTTLLLASLSFQTFAVTAEENFDDPELQVRYDRFTKELRCLVCQNQTIADSNAGLAQDLRNQTREMLISGASDEEIISYMTDRYGDFVLYRPPIKPKTWLLWFAPALFLLLGIVFAARIIRQRSSSADLPSEGEDAFDMASLDNTDGGNKS